MPGYKGHLVGGLCVYGLGLYLLRSYCVSYSIGIEWCICRIAGSLFPDIDIKSKGQKYFYWIIVGIFGLLIIHQKHSMLACASMLAVTPLLARHRGIFHNIWFILGLTSVGWLVLSNYQPSLSQILLLDAVFFFLGAASHIWLDVGFKRMLRY
ncbi:MAG: metal-dependent hydrolase [Candidatus Dependentiae bacterium]|nr:metal-dependent hydrolase [Candidatus Dependentiae bacterium]